MLNLIFMLIVVKIIAKSQDNSANRSVFRWKRVFEKARRVQSIPSDLEIRRGQSVSHRSFALKANARFMDSIPAVSSSVPDSIRYEHLDPKYSLNIQQYNRKKN